MNEGSDEQIWQGLRSHFDDLGPLATHRDASIPYQTRRRRPSAWSIAAVALFFVAIAVVGRGLPSSSAGAVGRQVDGDFVLEIVASADHYEPGAPIDISARLTYTGPQSSIKIFHGSPAIDFGVSQPVFGGRVSTVSNAIRSSSVLTRGQALSAPFEKGGVIIFASPEPSFLPYIDDPVFWLPTGDWDVYATIDFREGDAGPDHRLKAVVRLRVGAPTD